MTTHPTAIEAPSDARVASIALVAAGGSWLTVLMAPQWSALRFGPICGHASVTALHCPACYAAASVILAGVGLGVVGALQGIRTRRPARAR